MKRILTTVFLCAFSISVSAQTKCELPLGSAPTLFNLRLGMNGKEAKSAVDGKLKIKDKKEGVFFQNFIKKSSPSNLPGIRAIYLRFFDSKIYQIEIFYEQEPQEIEKLVKTFSAENNIDLELWEIKNGIAELQCDGFSIVSDVYLNPRIELTDTFLREEFKKSLKK
jgi:hypothetical protein